MPRRAKPGPPGTKGEPADAPVPGGVFDTAAPPPPQAYVKPAASAAPAGPARRSPMGAWALAMALSPLAVGALWATAPSNIGPLALLVSLLGVLYAAGPILGLLLGFLARSRQDVDPMGRKLALAAIVVSCAIVGAYFVGAMLLLYAVLTCGSGCAVPAAASASAPCATLATGTRHRRGPWREAFAHHPDLPVFGPDVYRVAGLRLCVGCFTAAPALAAAWAAATLWPLPPAVGLGAGLPLAAAQALSAAGWTTTRWRKVAVKACFGAGAGLLLHAVAAAPWPGLAKSAALAAAGLLALASTRPRLRRIARLAAGAPAPA